MTDVSNRTPRPSKGKATATVSVESADGSPVVAPAKAAAPKFTVTFRTGLAVPKAVRSASGRKSPYPLEDLPAGAYFLLPPEAEESVRTAVNSANRRFSVEDKASAPRTTKSGKEVFKRTQERHFLVAKLSPADVAALTPEDWASIYPAGFPEVAPTTVFGCWRDL